ncbi:MAG: hypothetical protein ACRERC_27190 [Candidatus Binatia bacterium]
MAVRQWKQTVLAAAILTLAAAAFRVAPTSAGSIPCDASLQQCNPGECPQFQFCRSTQLGCACLPFVCCDLSVSNPDAQCAHLTEAECTSQGGTSIPNSICLGDGSCLATRTPTATPTATATATASTTATPTETPVPNGGECVTPSQCASGICLNGICEPAPAGVPAASSSGLLTAVAVLIGLGGVGLLRRMRRADSE